VLWLVFTAVLAVAGAATLVLGQMGRVGPSAGSSKTYGCVRMVPANRADDDPDYCDRHVRDLSRRVELTQAQRDALAADQKRAEQALDGPGWCVGPMPADPADCARRRLTNRAEADRPDPADVEAVRQALREAGFAGAVVRIARRDDPATHGSIFFAIPLGDACFVGYLQSLRGGGSRSLVGRLPDGRC